MAGYEPGDMFLAIEVADPWLRSWHTEWITLRRRPMRYYLWYKQGEEDGEETVEELEGVTDPDSAWAATIALLMEAGFHDPDGDRMTLAFARVIVTAEEPTELSLYTIEKQIKEQRGAEQVESERARDEEEFKRLRDKLGR